MRAPGPRTRIDQSESRRPLLYALLGLVSALSKLDSILDHAAPPSAAAPGGTARPAGDDRVATALLGVVAIRQACGRHLSLLAARVPPMRASSPGRDVPAPSPGAADAARSLLR